MSRGPDAATQLARALSANPAGAVVTDHRATRWASATFVGARHRITMVAPDSPALDAWIAAVGAQQFALRGHVVADLAIDRIRRSAGTATIVLAALTVEDQ